MRLCYTKRLALLIFLFISSITSSFAQIVTVSDSVELGAADSLQCFYKLQTGNKNYHVLNDWDLGFQTQGITYGIWLNEAKGETLFQYPKGDTTAWNTIDTAGMSSWPVMHNSTTTWNAGAFNMGSTGPYDVGWGNYTGDPLHYVLGDSINLIRYPDGSIKKIMLQSLKKKVYYFKYANLDGSNEKQDSLNKLNFAADHMGYYSIDQQAVVDREPNYNTWDLLFTRHLTSTELGNGQLDIPFGSVYLNQAVVVSKVTGNDAPNFNPPMGMISDSNLTVIGVSYKSKVGSVWVTNDTTSYYVMDPYQNLVQLIFTGVDSSTGKIAFTKTTGSISAGVAENTDAGLKMTVFPNPASTMLNVAFTTTDNDESTVIISDIAGRQVMNTTWTLNAGANTATIPVQNLAAGMWLISVKTSSGMLTSKFIKTN